MSGAAYACRITKENTWAIASEKPNFDLDEYNAWLEEHKVGYFLRDEGSKLDCTYIPPEDFLDLYIFETGNTGDLFRKVVKIESI